jgi:hypothetical protein
MRLELKVSRLMTKEGESDTIRLSPSQRAELKINLGRRLSLTANEGDKFSLITQDAFIEDIVIDRTVAYVTQEVFDRVTGDKTNPLRVTLGCDPEFVFLDAKQNVLPASYWLPTSGVIGSDGPLAELRPRPAEHEDEVVETLRKLIKTLPLLMEVKFGSSDLIVPQGHSCWQNYAIGFHIHLGAPRELLTYAAPNTKEFLESFITVMDYFVGIPAMLLEDTNVRRLGNGTYGKPGDYRVSSKTIEYRTPGGFHLRHPEYAAGIMGLALCLGKEVLNGYKDLSNGWRDLDKVSSFEHFRERYNLPPKREIKWALLEPTKSEAVKHLPNMIEQLQKLDSFSDHKRSICNYFNLIATNTQYSPNLLQNW